MVSAWNISTKKDIVKPLQFVTEGDSVTTPSLFGVTPTASPAFTAAGLNSEIDINPDFPYEDINVLGSEDIVDAVVTGELHAFRCRFQPTDTVLINYAIAAAGGGLGTIDASLSFAYSEYIDGVENFTLLKGCRPTNLNLTLQRGTWEAEMTWVASDIIVPITTANAGLTTPTWATIPTASPLTHSGAGSDPFTFNAVSYPERRFALNIVRDLGILSVNGQNPIIYTKPVARRITYNVDVFLKSTTLRSEVETKTARTASYKFTSSPAKTLTFTNSIITNWNRTPSASSIDAFIESITCRAEGISIT